MTRRGTVLAGLAAAGLYLGAAVAAMAQSDPPDQVGRLAQVSGTVSFHTADDNQWSPATLNYPITNGNSLWTEPRSHAAVDVGSSRVYMDSSTELDIGTIDDQHFVASVPQGAVYARTNPNGGGQYEIDTPRGQVLISQPGTYEVVAGDADHPTVVTAYAGVAQIQGPGANLSVGAGQSASISGQDNQLQVSTGQAPPPDDFILFVQDEERPYANQPAQPPQQYGSPGMTGYQDLAPYGSWQSTPQYGEVWYPQVDPGWAPYRYGHWAYVWPWGWTWIDDARWGFAPFHYGRWVDYGGRWGWVPGAYQPRPVYSPALVAFFGDFGGISVGIAIGQAVGWVPLGPGEICYPGYRASPDYLRRMNVAYVHNTTIINYNYYNSPHGQDYSHYKNHVHGATMVSGDAMVHSRPIGQAWKQMPQGASNASWQHAKSFGGTAPIKPAVTTAGVTAGTARHIGLATTGTPNFKHAPGPQIQHNKQFNAAGTNGQGGNNFKGQTGGQGQAGGQNNLTGTNRGTTTTTNPPSNGTKIKTGAAPGPAITNNGNTTHLYQGTTQGTTTSGNGTQGNQAGGNNSNKLKTFNTQGNTTTNGNGTQGNQAGGNNSNKSKTFNTQGGTTTNGNGTQGNQAGGNNSNKSKTFNSQGSTTGNNQGNSNRQSLGTGQTNHTGTQGTGTVHTNATSGQQFNNQQNGQIHTNNTGGTQGQSGNSHNVQSGSPPKPPPPQKSDCKAGTKCN